jgi:hypothetical protein
VEEREFKILLPTIVTWLRRDYGAPPQACSDHRGGGAFVVRETLG